MPQELDPGVRAEWSWEGNVQEAIARFLVKEGWDEPRQADAASGQHGHDLETWRKGRRLVAEVKGFPATVYAKGARAGQPKPTKPGLQARHWFSHALLSTLLARSEGPEDVVVIGFPDVPVYRKLDDRTERALQRLEIGVVLVAKPDKASWRIAPGAGRKGSRSLRNDAGRSRR